MPALVAAWRRPEAWEGMTRSGGVDLPGQVGGLVALDEMVLHGWDLARATGQNIDCDDATARACMAFVSRFRRGRHARACCWVRPSGSGPAPRRSSRCWPTGRDPQWSPR